MTDPAEGTPLGREDLEKLLHRLSNLVSTIYAFGEPALETGTSVEEALKEILSAGAGLEETLKELKRALGEEGGEG